MSFISFCKINLQNATNWFLVTILGSAVKSFMLVAHALNRQETNLFSDSASLASITFYFEFGNTTSSSSLSRIFFSSANRFFIFFSALLIFTLMSVLALASAYSCFCAVKDILLLAPDFNWLFLNFSCSLNLKSFSSSIAGRTSSSGNYTYSGLLSS